jgi:hypothetical protein
MTEVSAPPATTGAVPVPSPSDPASLASSDAGEATTKDEFIEWLFAKTALRPSDKKLVHSVAIQLLERGRSDDRVNQAAIKFLQEAEQIFREESQSNREEQKAKADAEHQDQRKRREAELKEKEKRLTVELAAADQEREGEKKSQQREDERHKHEMQDLEVERRRGEELHVQDLLAKETDRIDGSRERNSIVSLNTAIVIATMVLAAFTMIFMVLTVKYQQPWGYAGTGVSLALTLIMGFAKISQQFQTLFALAKQGGGTTSSAEGPSSER